MEKEIQNVSDSAVVATASNVCTDIKIDNLNLINPEHVILFEAYVKRLIGSGKSGIKSVPDAIAIFSKAREYNLPFLSCVEHIHSINGKTGLDIHLIRALLLKAGVTWEKLQDFAPQYEYTDGSNVFVELPNGATKVVNMQAAKLLIEKDPSAHPIWICQYYTLGGGVNIRETDLTDNHKICLTANEARQVAMEKKFTPVMRVNSNPIDYVTEWKLTRYLNTPSGVKELVAYGKFSYSEAQKAELTNSNTYQKYLKTMISTRAFTYAAREIASDLLMGGYETNELRAINNQEPINIDYEEI